MPTFIPTRWFLLGGTVLVLLLLADHSALAAYRTHLVDGQSSRFPSLMFNVGGHANTYDISYAGNTGLKRAFSTNGKTWTLETIDSATTQIGGTSIGFYGGVRYIAYADAANAEVKLAYTVSSGTGNCPGNSDWHCQVIAMNTGVNDVSLFVGSNFQGGTHIDILYQDHSSGLHRLRLASCNDAPNCVQYPWTTELVSAPSQDPGKTYGSANSMAKGGGDNYFAYGSGSGLPPPPWPDLCVFFKLNAGLGTPRETIACTSNGTLGSGNDASIAVGKGFLPTVHVSFVTFEENYKLNYAGRLHGYDKPWVVYAAIATTTSLRSSIAVRPSGRPCIAYGDATWHLHVACQVQGISWSTTKASNISDSTYDPSLKFDQFGRAMIAHVARTNTGLYQLWFATTSQL
jgi:hypothetical protein